MPISKWNPTKPKRIRSQLFLNPKLVEAGLALGLEKT